MPVVLGESGVGKSHLLRAVAGRLGRWGTGLGQPAAGCSAAPRSTPSARTCSRPSWRRLRRGPPTVLALEGLELVFSATRLGPALLAHAIDGGARLVGTALPALLPRLEHAPLARRLRPVLIFPLSDAETATAVRAALPALAAHHGVTCDDGLAGLMVELSRAGVGHQPAKAIALADGACARARMAGAAIGRGRACVSRRRRARPGAGVATRGGTAVRARNGVRHRAGREGRKGRRPRTSVWRCCARERGASCRDWRRFAGRACSSPTGRASTWTAVITPSGPRPRWPTRGTRCATPWPAERWLMRLCRRPRGAGRRRRAVHPLQDQRRLHRRRVVGLPRVGALPASRIRARSRAG